MWLIDWCYWHLRIRHTQAHVGLSSSGAITVGEVSVAAAFGRTEISAVD